MWEKTNAKHVPVKKWRDGAFVIAWVYSNVFLYTKGDEYLMRKMNKKQPGHFWMQFSFTRLRGAKVTKQYTVGFFGHF